MREPIANDMSKIQAAKIAKKGKRGGFFFVEWRTFDVALGLGLHPAIALLVLASFSNRAGTLTRASANAIERRTGISRRLAHEAIAALEQAGVVRQVGTRARPRFTIAIEKDHSDLRGTLTAKQADTLAKATKGEKLSRSEVRMMSTLKERGLVRREGTAYEAIPREQGKPIWLPNEIVNGVGGDLAPIERIRQNGDVMLLRLFIDLYSMHELDTWGGVHPGIMFAKFDEVYRVAVGNLGVLAWVPSNSGTWVVGLRNPVIAVHLSVRDPGWTPLFVRISRLCELGLMEFVPHVVDGDGMVMYACPQAIGDSHVGGLLVERELGAAARAAASSIVTRSGDKGIPANSIVAIVPTYVDKAKLIGIARLKLRPRTGATAGWLSKLSRVCAARHEDFRRWARAEGLPSVGEGPRGTPSE